MSNHHRQSLRLKGRDYNRPGAYFVTIVTREREPLFGEIVDGNMQLNRAGIIAMHEWLKLAQRFAGIKVDNFVVMPNHVHGIIEITQYHQTENVQTGINVSAGSLGAIVRAYKSSVTTAVNVVRSVHNQSIWQKNYHEHIIRSAEELSNIIAYIHENPTRWREDTFHPETLTVSDRSSKKESSGK